MKISALFMVLGLCSCSVFDSVIPIGPGSEAPIPDKQNYLRAGPNVDIEMGQDERTLLQEFKDLNDTKIQLETQLSELRSENEQLRSQLNRTEEERNQLRNGLAGSSRENERMVQRSRDLAAKVLSLTIEKTKLDQELLLLRIASLRQQYDEITATATAAPPSGGGFR